MLSDIMLVITFINMLGAAFLMLYWVLFMLSDIMLLVIFCCYAGCRIFNGILSIVMLIAVMPSAVAPLKPMVETI
jgi:hypothetical protein